MKFRSLLIAAAALIATSAQAATFNFNGVIDAGPLATGNTPFSGSFDADTSSLSGLGFESVSLNAFSLNFLMTNFSGNASATADYQDGVFVGLSYSTATSNYTLSMTSGSLDTSDAFLHYTPTGGIESSGSYSVSSVPEPESHALMLGGLAAIGVIARRRKA